MREGYQPLEREPMRNWLWIALIGLEGIGLALVYVWAASR